MRRAFIGPLPPHRPTLITEPWYEFAEGSAPAMDVRFAAWSAFLSGVSGAAGHTYGGGDQWWARVPKLSTPPAGAANRSKPASDGGGWPRPDPGQDTLDFPGAASVGSDGNLYGTTAGEWGLANGSGTVFRVTASGTLTTLVSFNGSNGRAPVAGLLKGETAVR